MHSKLVKVLEGRDITGNENGNANLEQEMQMWNKVMQIWNKVMQIWETNTTRCQHYHISKLLRPLFGILCLLSSSLRVMTFPGVQLHYEHRNCCKAYQVAVMLLCILLHFSLSFVQTKWAISS